MYIFENKIVEDFLNLRENIDPELQESQQILSIIQNKTKQELLGVESNCWKPKVLKTADTQISQKWIAYGDPSRQAGVDLGLGCLLIVIVHAPQAASSYLCLQRGVV